MGWLAAAVLAGAAFALMAFLLKAPRAGWSAIGAALLFGLAGYGLQARADLPGSPRHPQAALNESAEAMVEIRRALSGQTSPGGNNFIVIADALARHGQYSDAAGVLLGAVEQDPRNAEAWLALANALVGHADGTLTPAALYAFRHAAQAAPDQPGPPFFLGLALAQAGRFDEARAQWAALLAASPADAPWRRTIEERMVRLDALIAAQQQAARPRR